jgi:hypothetical protein
LNEQVNDVNVDSRIARFESDLGHVKKDVAQIPENVGKLQGGLAVANQAAADLPPGFHALLRSAPGPGRPTRDPSRDRRGHQHPWPPALRLVGHMAATAFVFTSFITLVWLSSWGFSFLHSVHPFSDETFQLFEALKRVLILIDAALSGVVLLRGLWQYLVNVIRGQS